MLYEYLKETFGENEPILASEIRCSQMSENNIRQQLKRLADAGRICRYDTGIYFIPKKSVFKSGSLPSRARVIEKKYLLEEGERCGYIGGVMFANQMGLTAQVPMCCEVFTNKAAADCREVMLASSRLILRKPRAKVTEENYCLLRLLDLLKDIEIYEVQDKAKAGGRIIAYMKASGIEFRDLDNYLSCYPDKIYRNMYEMGLIRGVSA